MGLCILFREMNISFPLSAKPQFKVLKGIKRNTTHFLNKNFEQERSKKDSLKKSQDWPKQFAEIYNKCYSRRVFSYYTTNLFKKYLTWSIYNDNKIQNINARKV